MSLETTNSLHAVVNKYLWSTQQPFEWQALVSELILFTILCAAAIFLYWLIKALVSVVVRKLVNSAEDNWGEELLKSRLFTWVSLVIPMALIWKMAGQVFLKPAYANAVSTFSEVVMITLGFFALNSMLNIGERVYRRYEISKKFPIKGFLQVIKIILTISCSILIISLLIGRSPLSLFAGLGAMSAVLMFIFKDSILGLVAGIQLSANQMVARGDWIEMPKFGADGEVLEVALTTVKVRNWDKTITTLPTYALISDSFKNWRGMAQSNVRRIKRSLHIDLQTIRFVDDTLLQKLNSIDLLKGYIDEKGKDIQDWNEQRNYAENDVVNARVLTNIGTFRAYIIAYLKNHQQIAKGETLLVRQLQATEYGLPIEIYVFCNDNRWVEYEGIQSDIFDHFYAVLNEFDLQVFQRPSAYNFSSAH